jgi:hypothetical protein
MNTLYGKEGVTIFSYSFRPKKNVTLEILRHIIIEVK